MTVWSPRLWENTSAQRCCSRGLCAELPFSELCCLVLQSKAEMRHLMLKTSAICMVPS